MPLSPRRGTGAHKSYVMWRAQPYSPRSRCVYIYIYRLCIAYIYTYKEWCLIDGVADRWCGCLVPHKPEMRCSIAGAIFWAFLRQIEMQCHKMCDISFQNHKNSKKCNKCVCVYIYIYKSSASFIGKPELDLPIFWSKFLQHIARGPFQQQLGFKKEQEHVEIGFWRGFKILEPLEKLVPSLSCPECWKASRRLRTRKLGIYISWYVGLMAWFANLQMSKLAMTYIWLTHTKNEHVPQNDSTR